MDKLTKAIIQRHSTAIRLCGCVRLSSSATEASSSNSSSSNNNNSNGRGKNGGSLFKDNRDTERFQFNYGSIYEDLKVGSENNPFIRSSAPTTVSGNVKNVQGWKKGAQRGFRAVYPDLIQALTAEAGMGLTKSDNDILGNWLRKVLAHNLSPSTLGSKRYGVLVPLTYKQLVPDATKEQMDKAHFLGWAVELHRAFQALTNETVSLSGGSSKDDSSSGSNRQTWADKHDLGNKAFNDALLLSNAPHVLLQKFFRSDPNYVQYLDAFMFANRSACTGRLLQFDCHPIHSMGFQSYTYKTYRELVRHVVSVPSYVLPVSLALHLSGLTDARVHQSSRAILEEIGLFAQINRDYAGYFLEDNDFRDIREGRLTWMIAVARQRVGSGERQILDRCYGDPSPSSVASVRSIYKSLNMKRAMLSHLEEKRNDILSSIQQISKVDDLGLSQQFFFKLISSMESMDASQVD